MAFDYTGLRDETVEPLLDEFGKPGVILVGVLVPGPSYDPQPYANVSHPVVAVQTTFTKSDNKGTLVEIGDVMFLVSTKGVTIDPELAHQLEVDGVAYQVIRIDPLRPGPVTMLWKVHARK